jgi:hypothetical protein
MTITPESLAQTGTEAAHQAALFCWAAYQFNRYPELRYMHHIPNGGARADDVVGRKIRGAQLKAQGVKEGVPDIFLPVKRGSWSGLYIEMKKPTMRPKKKESKGGLSDAQIEFIQFVQCQGFGTVVCYDWVEAKDIIIQYLEYPK